MRASFPAGYKAQCSARTRIPEPSEWQSTIIGRLSGDYEDIAWCLLSEVPLTTGQ